MKNKLPALLVLSTMLLITGCKKGTHALGEGPGISVEERDKLQREMALPKYESEAKHIESVVEMSVDIPLKAYTRIASKFKLEDLLKGTGSIPGVVRTENLTKTWGPPGSRRRVVLEDGNIALEELIEDRRPELYRYEVWNFSVATGKFIKYAIGQFESAGDDFSTQVRWTYRFRPAEFPAALFMVPFVQNDYNEFMRNGIQAIRQKALEQWEKEGKPAE